MFTVTISADKPDKFSPAARVLALPGLALLRKSFASTAGERAKQLLKLRIYNHFAKLFVC